MSEEMDSELVEGSAEKTHDSVKRYEPIHGVGTFVCSDCVVDTCKNYVLEDFPEITQINTHDESEINESEMNQVALKSLIILIKKFPPKLPLFILDAMHLLNNSSPSSLFIGTTFDSMELDETKKDFFERIGNDLINLNLFNEEEKNRDNLSKEELGNHKHIDLEIEVLNDVYTIFTEKQNENDVDDLDIGFDEGLEAGMKSHYSQVLVALYKMYKKKKIKDLDNFIDELKNTICGMSSEEFDIWEKKFIAYEKKRKEKIELGDE